MVRKNDGDDSSTTAALFSEVSCGRSIERRLGDRSSSSSSMHRRAAVVDALVVGSCLAGPQTTDRGRVCMLGAGADGLLQALRHPECLWRSHRRLGMGLPSARGRSMMCCTRFRRLFACERDARGRSDHHVLSCRRRVLVQVICAYLCARASNLPY